MSRIVKVWESQDGKLFHKKSEADKYDKERLIEADIEKFVDRYFWNGISRADITGLLQEHKQELKGILIGIGR